MSENRWTEDDFVQLARPKMMAAGNPSALPHQLFEFFSEALQHYDNAMPGGKAYINRAMGGLSRLFEEERSDLDTPEASDIRNAIESLNTLLNSWRRGRSSGDPKQ